MSFKHYLAAALIPAALATAQPPATLTIDTTHPTAAASPTLYGLMTEEINYSYDGGLYPEMVNNRAFKNNRGPNLNHWTVVQQGISRASISADKTTGPSTALSHSLKLTVDAANPASLRRHRQRRLLGLSPSVPPPPTAAPSTPNPTPPPPSPSA